MSANITITADALPEGYCYKADPNDFLQDIAALLHGTMPVGYSGFLFGSDTPDTNGNPDNQDKPWIRTLEDGSFDGVYTFGTPNGSTGMWVRPHPSPPNGNERRIWVGTESSLWAYDGGNGENPATDPPTETTGAMWVVDTAFAFKFPLGAGTNATAYGGVNSVVQVGGVADGAGVAGAEKVALTSAQIAGHTHEISNAEINGFPSGTSWESYKSCNGNLIDGVTHSGVKMVTTSAGGDADGNATTHNNMPPYLGVYFIKRSARKYITVT